MISSAITYPPQVGGEGDTIPTGRKVDFISTVNMGLAGGATNLRPPTPGKV
ncbi:MAG: hypothetical protein Q8N39_08110 [Pelolinea sp.]|nr:hypothetical protein [Pelolinea sp.]